MQIDKNYWKICVRCEKSWDDDAALYCSHQEGCSKIEGDANAVLDGVEKAQTLHR